MIKHEQARHLSYFQKDNLTSRFIFNKLGYYLRFSFNLRQAIRDDIWRLTDEEA